MAEITPRKNRSGNLIAYSIRVFLGRGADGKAVRETTTFEVEPRWTEKYARKRAEAFAVKFEKDLRDGLISNSRQTFADYCQYVLELKASSGTKRSTIERYRGMTERIFASIGHLKIKDIRAEHLNRFYMDMLNNDCNKKTKKPLSAKTIKHYHELCSVVLETAFKEGIIPYNPARRVTLPKVEEKEISTFTEEEISVITKMLPSLSIKWQALISLLLCTGCRRGEIVGLRWKSVDFEKNTIRVENNVVQGKENGIYDDTPKTPQSIRTIGVPATAMKLLKDYQLWQKNERLRLGAYYRNQDYVFAQSNGNAMSPDSVSTFCRRDFSKMCGFPINPHKFRHTQASLLIAKGTPITTVSKRLGHAKVSTTLDIYAHSLPSADEISVDVLNSVLYQNANA